MATPTEQVNRKVAQLKRELSDWATKANILQPGEQLVLSLRIQQTPIVVSEQDRFVPSPMTPEEAVLEMDPRHFFTRERFKQAGFSAHLAGASVNVLNPEITYSKEVKSGATPTMRWFVANYSQLDLLRIPNFGRKCLAATLKLLDGEGLTLHWTRPK